MNYLLKVDEVSFPSPKGILINMMPLVIGDQKSIPGEYKHYWPLIEACQVEQSEKGKIGYLSIQESLVQGGTSQRRGGIHTEGHPTLNWGGGGGWGSSRATKEQGLYMGSSVSHACRAWNVHIDQPGPMGDCESYRPSLEKNYGIVLGDNEIYWLTDRTPHESLPLLASAYRQWFRLVTSTVDLWYRDHSTPNRLGVEPACKILDGNKFAEH